MHEKRLATESNNGSLIFLSLFLLLLAFFILLNALATIEETKSRQVLTSVAATFRSVVDADTSAQVLLSELGPASEPDEILEAMEQLWVTAVSVTKVETLSAGQLMQITMPVNELFLGGKSVLRSDRKQLLERAARVLSVQAKSVVAELELVLGTPPIDPAKLEEDPSLAIQRAVVLAGALLEVGAAKDKVSTGVRVGDPKVLRLRFAIREAARAQVTFESRTEPRP
jgi:hypothetical protein